jgi:flavin reductase (DIM6/NTAB) family NADH-FMN oxidoreductase RutF
MNETAAPIPHGENEMLRAKLDPAPSKLVKPPRVAAAPCALECRKTMMIPLHDLEGKPVDGFVVFGQVIGVHIDDRFIKDGLLDTAAMKPIARCGYHDYAVVERTFTLVRPES